MLNWDFAWDPSWAALMNPGQRPRFLSPFTTVEVSESCIDNLTWQLLPGHGQVLWTPEDLTWRYLTSCRLDSDLWWTVCVIWGNMIDDFSLDNMMNESTLRHSDLLFLTCATQLWFTWLDGRKEVTSLTGHGVPACSISRRLCGVLQRCSPFWIL